MPKVHRVTDPRLCGAVTIPTGLNTTVLINGLLASVVGDLDSHMNLGALISLSPQTILVQGIPMIVSLMDQGSPDMVHPLLTHVEGLPTPGGGSPNVTAYGGLGTFGGGLGAFQSLMGGGFGIPGLGEIMQLGGQVIGQVSRVANQGGGSGVVVMNNMPPAIQGSISSGTTITSANTGYNFTFSNYYSS
jgi:hypothetical protein